MKKCPAYIAAGVVYMPSIEDVSKLVWMRIANVAV